MAKKAEAESTAKPPKAKTPLEGQASHQPTGQTQPLLDTRAIYCGDNLEQPVYFGLKHNSKTM